MIKIVGKLYKTSYGTIHYWMSRVDKNKPWLVMLPGLTADHHLFDKQIEVLKEKYNCFTWDAPAHGLSRPFAFKFSMWDMAEYLHRIFEIEEIEMPILIGQSLGGYVSQVYMEMYPNSVSGFISIDSGPLKRKYYTGFEPAFLKHTKWMYLSIPWKLLLRQSVIGNAETEYGRKLIKRIWNTYDKKAFCELTSYGYKILAEAIEAGKSYEIKCPVLLLCGEKDAAGYIKKYNCRWSKQDNHKLIWIKGAGHNSNTDAPKKMNQLIENFVETVTKQR